MHILLHRELAMRQCLKPRRIEGLTLVRLAAAVGLNTSTKSGPRALGLRGDLQAIILRWGHSARSLQLSLTCCPERREIAEKCPPDVIADHIDTAHFSRTFPGVPPLVDVLAHAGTLRTVSVEWLRAHIESDYWFAYALDRGGHLAALSPEWLKANLRDDNSLSFALAAGGFLARNAVTPQWLADAVRCPRVLVQMLSELNAPVPLEWAARTLTCFHDFVALVGHALTYANLVAAHVAYYQTTARPPTDLALEMIEINHREPATVVRDVAFVFYHLQGVPRATMEDVLLSCDRFSGLDAFLDAHRRDDGELEACTRAIAAWGWHGDDAAILAVSVISGSA